MYGKVVSKDTSERPGFKEPGNQKPKAEKMKPKAPTIIEDEPSPDTSSLIPVELQRLLLNIFKDVFPDTLTSDTLQPLLQEIKTCLYARDFSRAFGKAEYLEAYAIRWSPVSKNLNSVLVLWRNVGLLLFTCFTSYSLKIFVLRILTSTLEQNTLLPLNLG